MGQAGFLCLAINPQVLVFFEAIKQLSLKSPAGHLPDLIYAGELIGGYLRLAANLESHLKCQAEWYLASVKRGVRSSRFIVLAACTTAGVWLFSPAIIIMPAFFTKICSPPFFRSQKR